MHFWGGQERNIINYISFADRKQQQQWILNVFAGLICVPDMEQIREYWQFLLLLQFLSQFSQHLQCFTFFCLSWIVQHSSFSIAGERENKETLSFFSAKAWVAAVLESFKLCQQESRQHPPVSSSLHTDKKRWGLGEGAGSFSWYIHTQKSNFCETEQTSRSMLITEGAAQHLSKLPLIYKRTSW